MVLPQNGPRQLYFNAYGRAIAQGRCKFGVAAVIFWADLLSDNWSYLTECIQTGKTANQVMESQGIASRWSKDPEAPAIFRAVMGTALAEDYMPIVDSWDFSGRHTVADLGGGGGALLIAVLKKYPAIKGMLVDRQLAIEAATPRFQKEELANICQLIGADLIQGVPRGADIYMMKHVLHGYADETAVKILKNCRSVMPAGGRLLLIEFVLPDIVSRVDPNIEMRLMSDLNMLAVTGGKERSLPEWKALLSESGFEWNCTIPVSDIFSGARGFDNWGLAVHSYGLSGRTLLRLIMFLVAAGIDRREAHLSSSDISNLHTPITVFVF